jgi:hypothetical protein
VLYKVYFYRSSVPNARPFASPTQEFRSLDEALRFAQDAAEAALVEPVHSFRIESEDRKINERWGRAANIAKLPGY